VPVAFWNARPARCPVEPTPGIPTEALPGLALSQATSSLRFCGARSFLPTIISGSLAIWMIGSRSFRRSNESV
jgi:hypothetical protein